MFVALGLMDLQAGLIRTPRPPVETLLDDPLRSLRAIRFAGRLGFKMDDELVEACRKKEVCSQKQLSTALVLHIVEWEFATENFLINALVFLPFFVFLHHLRLSTRRRFSSR